MSVLLQASVDDGPSGQVSFVVESKDGQPRKYEVEKSQLASSSRVFELMFQDLPHNGTNVITIKEFSPKAFKIMLRHVFEKPYCLDDLELALEVFGCARYYRLRHLQDECENVFAKAPITSCNVLEVFRMAVKHNVHEVLSTCEELFDKNIGDVLLKTNFIHTEKELVRRIIHNKTQLHPLHMLALINWGRHECQRRGMACNTSNVERCIISVCGPALAIKVSKVITKLSSIKRIVSMSSSERSENESLALSLPLCDSTSKTLMESFCVDIISMLKISVVEGTVLLTGIMLHLKPPSTGGGSPLEISYSAENMSEGGSDLEVKVNGGYEECKKITFDEAVIVRSGQCANITVTIEDLPISRCLQNSEVEQSFKNQLAGVHMILAYSSNRTSSTNQCGPFFIETLFYRTL